MSSQGLNVTALTRGSNPLSAVYFSRIAANGPPDIPGQGVPTGIPTQFASDYTRRLKQVALTRTIQSGGFGGAVQTTAITRPADFSIVQSNETRKSYQFGRFICTTNCNKFPDAQYGV